MKDVLALAIAFCLVGGYGMAAEYNGTKRPPAAVNGNEWSQNNRQDQNDNHKPVQGKPNSHKAGVYVGADTFGIFIDNASRKHYRNEREQMRRNSNEDRFGDWYADPNRYHSYKRSTWHKRDCFPVSRHAYDQRGRRVTVGATMCYTRDGRTYIAEGSRRTYR